jgi:hypothetical protein
LEHVRAVPPELQTGLTDTICGFHSDTICASLVTRR